MRRVSHLPASLNQPHITCQEFIIFFRCYDSGTKQMSYDRANIDGVKIQEQEENVSYSQLVHTTHSDPNPDRESELALSLAKTFQLSTAQNI